MEAQESVAARSPPAAARSAAASSASDREPSADVVILTALEEELAAVREVDDGAVAGSRWQPMTGPDGLAFELREFKVAAGRPLRVALARQPRMGATAATQRLMPLIEALRPRCIAMCGVCAGRPGKTSLGDVIAGERLFYHDTGKRLPDRVHHDVTTYQLRDDWKIALEQMEVADAGWLAARPELRDALPFRLHVAPIATGAQVIEDRAIWGELSRIGRKTLGLDMEAAALGELAHGHAGYRLDAIVMKGVMDHAGDDRDDRFKRFAARASAECLLRFLREHVPRRLIAGHDDVLGSGTSRAPAPPGARSPAYLLNARHTVAPWYEPGRAGILAQLDAWADAPRAVAVQLLHAGGGVGKTRLAIEWVRRRRDRHEVAGFLASQLDPRWLDRLCSLGQPVLIVIDYAETRKDLGLVLDTVAAFARAAGGGERPVLRVLLLARGDVWWHAEQRRSGLIEDLLRDSAPLLLPPLAVAAGDRERIYEQAYATFAAELGRTPVPPPPRIDLDDPQFERVLYLHMAALAALLGGKLDAGSLMDEILGHEERFWVDDGAPSHARAIDARAARQLIAAATLRGGIQTRPAALGLYADAPGAPLGREDHALVERLHMVYGRGRDIYLPALEPDLLGEQLVLRVASERAGAARPDRWIERVITARDDEQVLITAFTVLGRASARNAEVIRPWLRALLQTGLPRRAVLALRAGMTVGRWTASSWLGDELADALEQRRSPSIASRLIAELTASQPASAYTTAYQRVLAWIARQRVARAPRGRAPDSIAKRAEAYREYGRHLAALGKHDRALAKTEVAAALYRELAAASPARYEARLARVLNHLGNRLHELGRHADALRVTEEAVALYQRTAAQPGRTRYGLARGLHNLGDRLSDVGRRAAALARTREAVELRRALAAGHPDRVEPPHEGRPARGDLGAGSAADRDRSIRLEPGLARSLNSLGDRLAALGQRNAALAATEEAVELRRALAARNPDGFLPDLARSLTDLGIRLAEVGEHGKAARAAREAFELYRELAARVPDAFEPGLARSQRELALRLGETDQPAEALAAADQACERYRRLAARSRDVFSPGLAAGLHGLGNRLGAVGRHDEAIAALREAVELRRALAGELAAVFLAPLAASLTDLAGWLARAGEPDPALAAADEATALCRALVRDHPDEADAFQPGLARALSSLGDRRAERAELRRRHHLRLAERPSRALAASLQADVEGDLRAALACKREALDLIWPLFRRWPSAFTRLTCSLLGAIRTLCTTLAVEPPADLPEREQLAFGAPPAAPSLRRPDPDELERRSFTRGLAEGERAGTARAVLRVLASRQVPISPTHQRQILDCAQLATLDRWLDRACSVTSSDQLFSSEPTDPDS